MILADDANAWAVGAAAVSGVFSIAIVILQGRAIFRQREIAEHVRHINRAVNGVEDYEPTLRDRVAVIDERVAAIDERTEQLAERAIQHAEQLAEVRIQFRNHLKDHRTEELLEEAARRAHEHDEGKNG